MADDKKSKQAGERAAVSMSVETAAKVKALQSAMFKATGFKVSASQIVAAAVAAYQPPSK